MNAPSPRSRIGPCERCGWSVLGPPFRHARHDDPAAARYLTTTTTDHQEDP